MSPGAGGSPRGRSTADRPLAARPTGLGGRSFRYGAGGLFGSAALLILAVALSSTVCGCGRDRQGGGAADADGKLEDKRTENPAPEASPVDEKGRIAGEEQAGEATQGAPAGTPDSGGSAPPRARFEVFPLVGYAGLTAMDFNATLSKDDATDNPHLVKRWDYDGDGTWDTGPLRQSRTRYTYGKAGHFRPRLWIQDADGLQDSVVGSALEIKEPCPAPDFELTDVNPQSRSHGQKLSLERLRGKRVLVWYGMPSG